jgi:flagellum-specific ATP synthase
VDPADRALASEAVRLLAVLEKSRQLVELGAYAKGSHPALDQALELEPQLFAWLRQDAGGASRADAMTRLRQLLQQRVAA